MPTAAPIAMNSDARVIPGRECGSCTLCCKVYNIPEIGKAAGKWCKHCTPGKGCAIHETLPSQCAAFNCLWRTEEALPPHWKPEQSKMVITIFPLNGFIYVQVDPGAPSAWRKQPYYDQLRQWAKNNLQKGIHVIVFVNEIATLIMPDQDVPIGPMKPTDGISVRRNFAPGFAKYEATLIPGDTAGFQG
jgi:hypothetical protein